MGLRLWRATYPRSRTISMVGLSQVTTQNLERVRRIKNRMVRADDESRDHSRGAGEVPG